MHQATENRLEAPTGRDLRRFQITVAWMVGGFDLRVEEGKEIQI